MKNRKANEFKLDSKTYTAGLVLVGPSVKSIADGSANINSSYIHIKDGEAYLHGCYIPIPKTAFKDKYVITNIKLLLNKAEIRQLRSEKIIIPLEIVKISGRYKLKFSVGAPIKKHDKRAQEKEKQSIKDIRCGTD